MGKLFLDQYSLLHFSSGVMAYFVGIGALKWFVAHATFEFAENTQTGMKFINENLTFWPGGKPRRDALINILGDNVAAILGWILASKVDTVGKQKNWYEAQ